MRNWRGKLDMPHPLAPHLRQRHLDTALLADDAAELHPLVLSAQALIVLDRPEDAGAEQPIPLRLEGAVVDCLRLLDLAIRPGADLLWAGDLNFDLVECHRLAGLAKDLHQFIHATNTSKYECVQFVWRGFKAKSSSHRAPCTMETSRPFPG